jgi:Flp pilus assembly protein CpaB
LVWKFGSVSRARSPLVEVTPKMRRRLRYFRLFGLMTVIFVIVVAIYLGARKRAESPPVPTNEPALRTHKGVVVVVAATDLMPRTLLTPELLEEREARSAPEGIFSSKDEVVYRLTLTFIRKGEPIFRQHVTPPLKETSIAYLIPPGQVGIALTVSRPETVPPLRAGDYISIHAVFAGMKVRTIVPRAIVLAVNNRVGDIPVTASTQASPTTQQTSQQPQPSSPEKEQVTLFVALSPQEAKAVALAMDSGATFYYTLHSAPLPPLLPPGLERDLTLQELTGSPQVTALIVKKQHGELPQTSRATRTEVNPQTRQPPLAPVTLSPAVVSQLNRLDRSVQSLQQQVQRLEQRSMQTVRRQEDSSVGRQVIGVVGDQTITFVIPSQKTEEGGKR